MSIAKRRLKEGALILIITILLLETVAGTYLTVRSGTFFYSSPPPTETGTTRAASPLTKRTAIHPYLGYANGPGWTVADAVLENGRIHNMVDTSIGFPDWLQLKPNNHGFWSREDYPVATHSEQDFVVGVFGGSVAQWLAIEGQAHLIEAVRHELGVEKHIRVLNFAVGGYKQPQQLIALSYFASLGQHFDVVINVDGFNEAVLTTVENVPSGVDYSLPRSYPGVVAVQAGLAGKSALDLLAKARTLERSIASWKQIARQRFSALLNIAADFVERRKAKELSDLRTKRHRFGRDKANDLFIVPSAETTVNRDRLDAAIVDLWINSSDFMNRIAQSRGAIYVHVLQPNQYFAGKPLSTREKETAWLPDSSYAKAVRLNYPKLLDHSTELAARGVDFLDATRLFDHTTAPVYADTCCHYNELGNRMLANEIVAHIALSAAER